VPLRSTAAKRYAEAVAGIAAAENSWERWRADLQTVASVLADPQVRVSLGSPTVSLERKQRALDSTFGDRIGPVTRSLLLVMLRRGRINLLPDVVAWFDEMADRARGVKRVTVTSAVPLDDADRRRLQTQIAGREPRGPVVLEELVDPEIIGGIVIREGDVIRDYSVRGRLESLRERLN
jgi:F-type H+-transporting ATPase subunit delta